MAEGSYMDRIIDEQKSATPTETPELSEQELTESDVTPTETGAQTEQVEQQPAQFYTPEEVEELLKTDGNVDFRRLSPEGQAIWKSVDRGLKPKLEEAARIREEYNQFRSMPQQQQVPRQPQPANLYEMFVQDPDGVMRYVKNTLYQAKLTDPYSEEVTKLEMLRDDLYEKRQEIDRYNVTSRMAIDEAYNMAKTNIPDYETKREKLTQFAEGLGLNRQELGYLTNPLVTGALATKLTFAINTLYDKINVGDIRKKEVKKNLTVEHAGSGFETKKDEKWGDDSYIAMRAHSLL